MMAPSPISRCPAEPDLARQDAAIADARRSRQADLAAEDRILADFAGMADQHQVVDFRAPADARFADGRAVDAGIGLNFHVVFDHDGRLSA